MRLTDKKRTNKKIWNKRLWNKMLCILLFAILLTGCNNAGQNEQSDQEEMTGASETQYVQEESILGQGDTAQNETTYLAVEDVKGTAEDDFEKYETTSQTAESDADVKDGEEIVPGNNAQAAVQTFETNEKSTDDNHGNVNNSDGSGNTPDNNANNSGGHTQDNENNVSSNVKSKDDSKTDAAERTSNETQVPTCTLMIECVTVLSHMDQLKEGKEAIVPANGIIYAEKAVEIQEGDTVFDVLQRELQSSRIPFEYTSTPAYSGNYIEGINNLYEFDCGELSGWMYSVNGVYPNYGCSQYPVQSGDAIAFRFTCDLGKDIGK